MIAPSKSPQVSGLRSQVSDVKITCLILTYNEEHRIRTALTHATRWADEVIVLDKGSTDRTVEIARGFACVSPTQSNAGGHEGGENTGQTPGPQQRATVRVHALPFSRQGHESYADMVSPATHDWVWHFTPGEVPTRKVIEEARRLVNFSESPLPDFSTQQADSAQRGEEAREEIRTNTGHAAAGNGALDLILIPTQLWSFGVHDPRSPWGFNYQPRLYHKGRVRFTGVCHAPIQAEPGRTAQAPGGHDCYVLHPTHATVEGFLRSHLDYSYNEARRDLPERVIGQALWQVNAHDQAFASNPDLLIQQLAWKIYWMQTAISALELHRARDVPAEYRALTAEALKAWSA